ncbi:universal stress protein [Streptomyces sp. NPDC046977]|uniref:universal stress protein n=1 Tax=Streptomyces sp. NPDC046977 TaxID=3154703 RepID=UPI0033FBB3F9
MEVAGHRRVVVGVSGSLGSLAALHRAAAEARRRDAALVVVHAWEPAGGEFSYRRQPCPPLLRAGQDQARLRLLTAMDNAFGGAPPGLGVQALIARGPAARCLVHIADREDDLLVVGAGRPGLLRRLLASSVAHRCVRDAVCPVLSVPRPSLQELFESVRRRNARQLSLRAAGPL